MDKESIYELQKIDCNCNDCFYMMRDMERYRKSLAFHEKLQQSEFDQRKTRLLDLAEQHKSKGNLSAANALHQEVSKMKFQFDKKSASINYGYCHKFDKEVSFIPGHCQLETQECFMHRKDFKL